MNLTPEDISFLKNLANEMKSQNNYGTASPYFYVARLIHHKPTLTDYGDGVFYVDYHPDGNAVFYSKEEYIEHKTLDGMSPEEIEIGWKNLEICGYYEILDERNVFLTKRSYDEHILLNGHNYNHSKECFPFIKHAERNPEIKRLFEIIKKFAD